MITLLVAVLALVAAGAALAIALFTRREADENAVRLQALEIMADPEYAAEKPAAPAETHLDYSIVEDAARARAARDAARGAR